MKKVTEDLKQNQIIVKELLEKLELKASCDTFSVRSEMKLTTKHTGIENVKFLTANKDGIELYTYKVQCDDIYKGYNMTAFRTVIEYVLEVFKGAKVLYINRLDIRYDNFEKNCFQEYYKINALFLSLIARKHTFTNNYAAEEFIEDYEKNINMERTAHDYEIVYYNKGKQKESLGIGARLEMRCLQTQIDLLQPYEGFTAACVAEWFDKITKAITRQNFKGLKSHMNRAIASNYKEGEFVGIAEYMATKCLKIFDTSQAAALAVKIGGVNNRNLGYQFFENRPLQQIIGLEDIKAYFQIIRNAARKFLCSD